MDSCLFCDIAAGKIPSTEVFSDEDFLAFADIDAKAPTHILVIPRRHVAGLNDLEPEDADLLGRMVLTATAIAAEQDLSALGYRFVINCGQDGGQTVPHLHLHILGGRPLAWPPG
ncbi:MAG: histidine triad nucleotide-binding protein [Gemmatimonadales bacterium]|nr:histidine triad nucleotide-binding protein [Gemmatimonadales bacterium]